MRSRTLTVLGVLLWAELALGAPAQAQDGTTSGAPSTTAPELAGAVGIGDNTWLTGGVITPPDGGATRTFDAYEAAVFVQSWLPTAVFGDEGVVLEEPPNVPVSRVDLSGQWGPGNLGTMTVYFATEGGNAYVSWPQDQPIAAAPGGPPPPQEDWFIAPARAIDAFNGEAELIDTEGVRQATSTTTVAGAGPSAAAAADDDTAERSVWVWGAGIGVLAVLALVVVRRRQRGQAVEPAEPADDHRVPSA